MELAAASSRQPVVGGSAQQALSAHGGLLAIKLFEDEYNVPLIDPVWAARLAAFNELTFPVLLVFGLATPPRHLRSALLGG